MHTMNKKERNPVIRVKPNTRKLLKIIAAWRKESMQDTVDRLAIAEYQVIANEESERVRAEEAALRLAGLKKEREDC
jgi:hypothetical protein